MKMIKQLVLLLVVATLSSNVSAEQDKYQWLEEVEGKSQLAWVKKKNAHSLKKIKSHPKFSTLVDNNLKILNSKERIPYARSRGDYLYNYWKDDKHVRGIYRRTSLAEYKKQKPNWETVIDLDALGEKEGISWVYKGMNCYYPANEICLLSLSRGGADAVEIREFNLKTKQFVNNGFFLPEAKSGVSWIDKNTLLVGTDFKDGSSMTDSGYPKLSKLWHRGTPLSSAKTIYSGNKTSVSVGSYTLYDGNNKVHLITEADTFYTQTFFIYDNETLTKLSLPADAAIKGLYQDKLFVELKSDWKIKENTFKQGEVISTKLVDLIADKAQFTRFIKPTVTASIASLDFTESAILVTWLDNVKSKLVRYHQDNNGLWQKKTVPFPVNGTISAFDFETNRDQFFVNYTSFLEPSTLYLVDAKDLSIDKIKGMSQQFDAAQFKTEQHMATSKDGTKIPYFIVMNKNTEFNGKNPTLLYGYGGFEISLTPYYSASTGKNWLEQGGVFVLANIRGGGEFGPRWHQAALKENRYKAYEDFEAIAEDLIARNITSSKHLGIHGGSNGGLLVGAAFTRRPELYNAVVCQVPLLDMKRFNKLLAGASWMGEYGNPDIAEEWEYIKTYSPYHNVKSGINYPKVFFTTSTRDDRVHPAHARKMVAKMENLGHEVYYYENIEGGHAGAADNNQAAELKSMTYAYLLERLAN